MRVRLSNQQNEVPLRVRPLLRQLKAAPAFLPRPLPAELTELNFVLVDRETIARIHCDFLGDPTETDVITFPYGEILVCPAVAREQGVRHGLTTENETLLYALHGLLHLTGYEDGTPSQRRRMFIEQDKLWRRFAKGV